MLFSAHELLPGCEEGIEAARALFDFSQKYTLREIIDAGAKPLDVLWLIFQRADDPDTLAKIREGVGSAALSLGLSEIRLKSKEDCWACAVRCSKTYLQKNCSFPISSEERNASFRFVVDKLADLLQPKEPAA